MQIKAVPQHNTHDLAQLESNLGELESLVPSASPPGLIQTIASMYEEGVVVEGLGPNPAPLTLHQSPQA